MKQNKETVYSINKKEYKSFQYTARDTLIQKGRGKNPERVIKNKYFINIYKQEGFNFLSEKHDWKKSKKNNVIIALIVF